MSEHGEKAGSTPAGNARGYGYGVAAAEGYPPPELAPALWGWALVAGERGEERFEPAQLLPPGEPARDLLTGLRDQGWRPFLVLGGPDTVMACTVYARSSPAAERAPVREYLLQFATDAGADFLLLPDGLPQLRDFFGPEVFLGFLAAPFEREAPHPAAYAAPPPVWQPAAGPCIAPGDAVGTRWGGPAGPPPPYWPGVPPQAPPPRWGPR